MDEEGGISINLSALDIDVMDSKIALTLPGQATVMEAPLLSLGQSPFNKNQNSS